MSLPPRRVDSPDPARPSASNRTIYALGLFVSVRVRADLPISPPAHTGWIRDNRGNYARTGETLQDLMENRLEYYAYITQVGVK